jgi:hypothetical protein
MNSENPAKKAKIDVNMEQDDDFDEMSSEKTIEDDDEVDNSANMAVTSTVMDIDSLPLAPSIESFFLEPEVYAPRVEFLSEFIDVSRLPFMPTSSIAD